MKTITAEFYAAALAFRNVLAKSLVAAEVWGRFRLCLSSSGEAGPLPGVSYFEEFNARRPVSQ
jgi:hypothetical protein